MAGKTLLISCCAPCVCAVIEKMAAEKKDFAVLFYNPNIVPEEEHDKRRFENQRLCDHFSIRFFALEYDRASWIEATEGLDKTGERNGRCEACFALRFRKAAVFAKENGFDTVTSVFGVSRHKDFDQVARIGKKICEEAGLAYDSTNWRKNGLEQRRHVLIKELRLYEQTYCGCKPEV